MSRAVVRSWIGVGGTVVKSPNIATPQVFSLKPPVCAPSTGRVMPPARPSKTWPYLSTSALYAMSHQPSVRVWYS